MQKLLMFTFCFSALVAADTSTTARVTQQIGWGDKISGNKVSVPTSTGTRLYTWLADGPHVILNQNCTSPTGQKGKCRFVHNCAYPEFLHNFNTFIRNACFIGTSSIGVCCTGTNPPVISKVILGEREQTVTSKPTTTSSPLKVSVNTTRSPGKIQTERVPSVTSKPTTTSSPLKVSVNTTKSPGKIQTTLKPAIPVAQTTKKPTQTIETRIQASCGAQVKHVGRIVGGTEADEGDWPWMAALMRDGQHFCGGSLISNRHILTAAHCVRGTNANEVVVRLGEYDFRKPNKNRKEFQVERIIEHENYARKVYKNDIALLKLKTVVTYTSAIRPVCLPQSSLGLLGGKSSYVAGWGQTAFGENVSKVLLEVAFPIWTQENCQEAFKSRYELDVTQLCAGVKEGGKDSCRGDSGGPLMYQVSESKWAVVGIVSFGDECAKANRPGIYTRVTAYLDWIKKNSAV